MSQQPERVTVELDAATANYLRQRCMRRGDLAGAAADALHQLAVRDAAEAMVAWEEAHPSFAENGVYESEQALSQAS
jgi:hypothetical protein